MLPVVLAMMASRLPVGISSLAVLLYVAEESGSFGTAGLVSGLMGLGTAVGGPLQSRLVDDSGIRVLNLAACAYGVGMATVWLLGADGDLLAPLLLAALVAGAALPSTSSVMRSRWPVLLRDQPGALTTAYALDSVLIQIIFVVGPLLTAVAVATIGIEGALAISVLSGVAGTLAFTTLLGGEGGGRLGQTSILHLGALVSPGLRTLTYASVPLGFFLGSFEVGLPAYAEQRGDPELAGALIAVFAAAGIVGGLAYGARPQHGDALPRTHLALSALLPVLGIPLVFVSALMPVALFTALGGLLVSPVIASRNEMVHAVSVEGREAESFAWPLTAMIVGLSLGFAVSGGLAGAHGWEAAIVAGCAAATGGAILLAARMPQSQSPSGG